MAYICFKCQLPVAHSVKQMIFHIRGTHAIGNNEKWVCFQDGCLQTFKMINSFSCHINRFHPLLDNDFDNNIVNNVHNDDGVPDLVAADVGGMAEDVAVDDNMEDRLNDAEQIYFAEFTEEKQKHEAAKFIIKMRGTASVTTSAVSEMINSTSMLLEDTLGSLKEKVTLIQISEQFSCV